MATEQQQLIGRGHVVDSLSEVIRDGDFGIKHVPGLLKRVCNEGAWRKRFVRQTREVVEFGDFTSFVTATPPDGLGVDLDTLRKLCRDDAEARDIIDRETQRPAHLHINDGDRVNHPINNGDRVDKHLRRLRKDFGDQHHAVISGAKSVTRAAVEAGIYPHRVSINLQSPKSSARTIDAHADAAFIGELIRALTAGENS